MTFDEELRTLRAAFCGTKSVGLHPPSAEMYFKPGFLRSCVDEYEQRALSCLALKEKLTPLEQLAVVVLRSSAGLK